MNKKHIICTILLVCIVAFNSYSQVTPAGVYKLYYTEFKSNNEIEEFFYLRMKQDNSFEIITPYTFSETPFTDDQRPQDTFAGRVEMKYTIP